VSAIDSALHFLTIGWKMLFATIPPPHKGNGWFTFFVCLIYVGLIMFVVIEMANLFGCVTDIDSSMTALTILAIGLSIVETIVSIKAAINDTFAEAALST
jgi:magnesium/proton exchanger